MPANDRWLTRGVNRWFVIKNLVFGGNSRVGNFKNTSYLLVKIALRFPSQEFPKFTWILGCRQGPTLAHHMCRPRVLDA